MKKEKLKLIIDTDPGHDDAMAILMMLASSKYEFLAVTTVAGNSTVENTTRNAKFILDLARCNDIPVYSGAAAPLARPLIRADVHGKTGLDGSDGKIPETKVLTGNACDKIAQLIKQNPDEITILALGPLTNIAEVILRYPQLIRKVKKLVIMGGAISVPGNKSRVAEFNFFVDPEAAKIVLEADVPKVLVPLDPCNDILMQEAEINQFGDGRVGTALFRMLQPYIKNIAKFEGVMGAMMYDPLAAYYLLDESAFEITPMDIVIETKGEFTAGMSVVEKRILAMRNNNIKVVTKIDGKKFLLSFISSIKQLDERKK